jgi:hypothetical protein
VINTVAEIEEARALLVETPVRPANPWAGLGAAALAAMAALLLAGVMVLGPGFALKDPAVPEQFEN